MRKMYQVRTKHIMIAYVVFTKARQTGWIFKFLHKDISHCYLMMQDRGTWLVLDNSVNRFAAYTISDYSDILSKSIIIKVKTIESVSYFGLNTCVSFVKRFIGLKDIKVQTPYQLFKRLSWDFSEKYPIH